ncbi:glutamate--cysteine ligase [Phytohabitans flavus]|nr:glutamate--cysteine ligase [Phytohabitans flavus]
MAAVQLTVGVEEEFLLLDAEKSQAAPAVDAVLAEVPGDLRGQVAREYLTSQIEINSPPGLDLRALRHSLGLLRTGIAGAAERAGARVAAIGCCPVAGPEPPVVDEPRFHRMVERFGALSPGPGLNGVHVHIGVPDPHVRVQVLNHLRPWLPLLHAATTNSPFADGRDSGYASWRSVMWERWPSVGPTPYLESHDHYEDLVARLTSAGAMLDEAMLYWYARLSARYPTVELRIGDVCPTLDDTILVAALARGLVGTVLGDIEAGRPAPRIDHHLLSAAHWRAAHDGLSGLLVDPADQRSRPAWHLFQRLFDTVRPELERTGDLELVTLLMGRLRSRGTGASRQRAVYARTGDMAAVLDHLTLPTSLG